MTITTGLGLTTTDTGLIRRHRLSLSAQEAERCAGQFRPFMAAPGLGVSG